VDDLIKKSKELLTNVGLVVAKQDIKNPHWNAGGGLDKKG
jgi:hypothetical protein